MKGPVSAPPVETQFAQKLAANDKKDRDRAIKKLKKWLGGRETGFPEEDMMRIWKGLFYCFWMSDKPLIQEELAENISSMVSSFNSVENSLVFVTCFAKTFQREWFGIDRWRMDKTMMFVRRFLRHVFKLIASKSWEEKLVKSAADIFRNTVILSPESDKSSLGFQLHFTDVFLEELAKVGGENLSSSVVETFIQPWIELVTNSKDKRLREHAEERIFNHLLRQSDPGIDYQMKEDGVDDEEEMEDESDEEMKEESDEEMKEENDENSEEETMEGSENDEKNSKNGTVAEDVEENSEEEPEDPRAGRVNVFIPQVCVEYSKIGNQLFKLGSEDGVGHHNREALYRISKKFKDVSDNIFPLGPNLDEIDVDIPKINIKKASKELMKRNEKLRKDNESSKREAKLLAKQKKMGESVVVDKDETDPDEEVSEDSDSEKTHKRKSESDDDEEPIEKKPKREAQKKKKQERKRMKREAALKESLANTENERKKREQLDHDILVKSTLDQKVKTNLTNGTSTEHVKVGGNKKRKETAETINDSEPIKKAKISMNGEAEDLHRNAQSHIDETSMKKNGLNVEPESPGVATSVKKKKKKIREAEVTEKISSSIPEENLKGELTSINSDEPKLKKKKKKIQEAELTEEINSSIPVKNENEELTLTPSDEPSHKKKKKKEKVVGLESRPLEVTDSSGNKKKQLKTEVTEKVGSVDSVDNKSEEVVLANGDDLTPKKKKKKKVLDPESDSEKNGKTNELNGTEEVNSKVTEENEKTIKKSNPKLKKKKKEMHRIDSDICFNAPSLSKTNLSLEDMQEKPKPLPTLAPITEVSTPTLPASQKKKMKKYKAEVSLSTASPKNACVAGKLDFGNSNGKVFEESEWDEPLKPGEQELVIPNKNYKGDVKLEKAKEGQLSPQITPAKSFTATFLKKAVSKSATPKKTKKSLINGVTKSECASEPRKKKINFALTQNKSQDFVDHLKAVKSSPQTPHDPSRNPSKTLLKKRTSMESNQKKLNPVGLNTQLNGRSKTMKHLVGSGKRATAMDFF